MKDRVIKRFIRVSVVLLLCLVMLACFYLYRCWQVQKGDIFGMQDLGIPTDFVLKVSWAGRLHLHVRLPDTSLYGPAVQCIHLWKNIAFVPGAKAREIGKIEFLPSGCVFRLDEDQWDVREEWW